jgi:hypothetical protein
MLAKAHTRVRVLVLTAVLLGAGGPARAVTTSYDMLSDYLAAIAPQQIFDFTEVLLGTTVTTQYIGLGVEFTDGDNITLADASFVNDGVGLDATGSMELLFSTPITPLGFEFPGALTIEIFDSATSLGVSSDFAQSGSGFFRGITSTVAFNRAIVSDWYEGNAFVDTMCFGQVPKPSTATLLCLGLAGLATVGRKRSAVRSQ